MVAGGTLRIETANVTLNGQASVADLHGGFVTITVSDTGVGMAPAVLERAFEPFYTTKESGQGTGLGLSMVYGFTKQSGGVATIASEIGRGTAVTLFFPRNADQSVSSPFPAASAQSNVEQDHVRAVIPAAL
jgi:signal transduction histidine kinase